MMAILLPMLKPDQLPALNFRVQTLPYSAPRSEAPPTEASPRRSTAAPLDDGLIHVPRTPPNGVDMGPDKTPVGPVGPFVDGLQDSTAIGVIGLPLGSTSNPPSIDIATTKPPRPQTLVVSHLDEGMLIRRVQPVYPHVALITRTQGKVVLSALISTHGEIEGLRVISGPPLLAQSAIDAVRQWRYRPYILNGSPIEVQTEVTVNFSLQ